MREVLAATPGGGIAVTNEMGEDEPATAARARTDRAAFGLLYLRYVDRVYAYCYRQLGDAHAAEDATSAVFMKALAAIPRYRPGSGSFRSWLFAIAHNTIVDERRRKRPAAPFTDVLSLHAAERGPEAQAIAADEARALWALLDQLPPAQAQVVQLRLAGLEDQEIARVLGRSHGAVRVAQHRAITRLRAIFEADSKSEREEG